MSTTAKAKEALDLRLVEYRRCRLRVSKALDFQAPNKRTISNKMQQLSDAVSQLNIYHTIWVTKAGFSEGQLAEEKYSKNWLGSKWKEVDNLQDQVDELHMQDLPDSIKITLSQIETLKSGISTKLTQLLAKTSPYAVPTII